MKILHLSYSNYLGGASIAAQRIHSSLKKINLDSKMWVNKTNLKDSSVDGPSSKSTKLLIKLKSYLVRNFFKYIFNTQSEIMHSVSIIPSRWSKKINNSDADIVHLHWIQDEMISIREIGEINKPIVWTLHDMWTFCGAEHYSENFRWVKGYFKENRPDNESGFDLNKWTWERKKKYWKKPMQIITPSKWLANCVSKSALLNNWPLSVIGNPIDTDCWKPINKKLIREHLNLKENAQILLFGAIGGSKDPRKGFDLLTEALNFLRTNKEKMPLELMIFGESSPKIKPDFGFPVHYMGHIQDELSMQIIYNAADIMIIPSRQDNLPNSGMEAAACGIPLVAFDIGGMPDIVQHKKTGYLAKAFDINDLSNGILWVLNEKNYNDLSKNARKETINKFSEKKIAYEYQKIYENLLI